MMMMSLPAMPPRSHLVEDFGSRSLGSLVGQGWSHVDNTTAINWTVEADGASLSGRRLLVDKTTSDAIRRISFDLAGSSANVDVLVRLKAVNAPSSGENICQVNVRAGTEAGYFLDFGFAAGAENHGLWEITGLDTSAEIEKEAFNYDTSGWFWARIRANGTSIQGKHWADGDPEPAFSLSGTDATFASGKVALGSYFAGLNHQVDYFSVGLSGATAPGPAG